MATAHGRVLGFAMLFSTVLLWVGSSALVQTVFNGDLHYGKPLFVTLFNSATSAIWLLPRLATASLTVGSLASVVKLSATVGLLWLCSAAIFNISLEYTSVATNTVLSSTTSVFTFLLSLLICKDTFRWSSLGAAVLSLLGCSVVACQVPQNIQEDAVTNSVLGDVLALTSAGMFALSSVLLRRFAPEDLDLGSYMGVTGLIALGLAPGLLYAAHVRGLEQFSLPERATLAALIVNALFGCTLANYLYNSALLLLSPLVANICLSLSIPVSALMDEALLGQHRFSATWALGAAVTTLGAVIAALDLSEKGSGKGEGGARKSLWSGEHAEADELQSLLRSNGCPGSDDESEGGGDRGGHDAERLSHTSDCVGECKHGHALQPRGRSTSTGQSTP
mmetsp:Transcript_40655/g.107491  ORF Transcript_40655/g.107491 Transcript_40655/m.107491 type:complete len:393 (-) Transcript_40655:239-1417(-)